jgi:hypothetical protein
MNKKQGQLAPAELLARCPQNDCHDSYLFTKQITMKNHHPVATGKGGEYDSRC